MNLALRILWMLICFVLGVLLILAPWHDVWQRNVFLERYPGLIPWMLSPYVRGAISGLGLLDILIAFSLLRSPEKKEKE
jgi:hypothetical protein